MTGSIVGHAVNYINPTFNPDKEPAEFQAGRMVGSAAALYQGIAELIGGAGEIVGGGAATIISPAAGPGAPAVAVGGIAVSGAGVALAGVGIAHTGFGVSSLYNSSRVFFAKGRNDRGKELVREGEKKLGRGHNPKRAKEWQDWYRNLTPEEKRLYRKNKGPHPRKRN